MFDENPDFTQSSPSRTCPAPDATVVSAGFVLFFGLLTTSYVALWFHATRGAWPTLDELPVSWIAGTVTTLLLVLSSVAMILAIKAARTERWRNVRGWLIAVVLLGSVGLGIRIYDYGRMAASVAVPWKLHTMLFDHADLYYMQAVQRRLAQHAELLEAKQTDHPDLFDDTDAQNLDLVQQLQTNMVTWTQRQVAQWLVSTDRRRQLMQLLAYQVYPLARTGSEAKDAAAQEKQALVRIRQWLMLLRNRSALMSKQFGQATRSNTPSEPAKDAKKDAGNSGTSDTEIRQERLRLEQALTDIEKGLDAEDRRVIASVLSRTIDARSAKNQVTEMDTRLQQIDQRLAFIRRFIDPIQETTSDQGLNYLHRWLQLPINIPGAKTWFASYDLLVGLHSLLLSAMLVSVGFLCFRPMDSIRNKDLFSLGVLWHTLILVNIVITGVLFIL